MSSLTNSIRRRHETARTRREVRRAIKLAGSDAVRAELVAMAMHQGLTLR